MTSLIEELQKDSLNHTIKITELLQKALVVTVKLNLNEFSAWVRLELDGYGATKVPSYRILHGAVRAFNPYRGYQPIDFKSIDIEETFSRMHFATPIGQIEYDVNNASHSNSDTFEAEYSPKIRKAIMDSIGFQFVPSLNISTSEFQGVLDAVRKIILEWSLTLEADGITGDGLSFTVKEKTIAKGDTYHIRNFIKGYIQGSQIQLEAVNSSQNRTIEFEADKLVELITALKDTFNIIGLDINKGLELNAEINTIEAQLG